MQISLKLNFDGQFSLGGGAFSSIGFNAVRVGVWVLILGMSLYAALLSLTSTVYDWEFALGVASPSFLVSGKL
jgi:hypothetical protein